MSNKEIIIMRWTKLWSVVGILKSVYGGFKKLFSSIENDLLSLQIVWLQLWNLRYLLRLYGKEHRVEYVWGMQGWSRGVVFVCVCCVLVYRQLVKFTYQKIHIYHSTLSKILSYIPMCACGLCPCVQVCVCVCMYISMDMHTFVYTWVSGLEVSARCLMLYFSLSVCETWSFIESGAHWFGETSWLARSRNPLLQALGLKGCTPPTFNMGPHACVLDTLWTCHQLSYLPSSLNLLLPHLQTLFWVLEIFSVKICSPLSDQYLSQRVPILKLLCSHVSYDWQTNQWILLSEITISSFFSGPRCKFRGSRSKCSLSACLRRQLASGFRSHCKG